GMNFINSNINCFKISRLKIDFQIIGTRQNRSVFDESHVRFSLLKKDFFDMVVSHFVSVFALNTLEDFYIEQSLEWFRTKHFQKISFYRKTRVICTFNLNKSVEILTCFDRVREINKQRLVVLVTYFSSYNLKVGFPVNVI